MMRGNNIATNGNECVEAKEGSSGKIFEHNVCSNQRDSESGCFASRGDGNTIRYIPVRVYTDACHSRGACTAVRDLTLKSSAPHVTAKLERNGTTVPQPRYRDYGIVNHDTVCYGHWLDYLSRRISR